MFHVNKLVEGLTGNAGIYDVKYASWRKPLIKKTMTSLHLNTCHDVFINTDGGVSFSSATATCFRGGGGQVNVSTEIQTLSESLELED